MSAADDESFLARWSRRKAEVRRSGPQEPAVATAPAPAPAVGPSTGVDEASAAGDPAADVARTSTPPSGATEPNLPTEADLAILDGQSDYSRFMLRGVPEELQSKALRKLWDSDPAYAAIDPFQDYCGDYTDAACAVPGGIVRTAYKYGQGFLDDDEAAEWDRLGKPEPESETARESGANVAGDSATAGAPEAEEATTDATAAPQADAAPPTKDPRPLSDAADVVVASSPQKVPGAADPA